MPIADWTVPFELTSQLFSGTTLPINTPLPGGGIYYLNPQGCSLGATVRSTKNDVPQADGSILHRRFLTGMEMELGIQLWQNADAIACDALQQTMLDDLMGYCYGLLNATDNEGRISWTPADQSARMLDNLRLLSYPTESHAPGQALELRMTLDTKYPYAQDLNQTGTNLPDGTPVVVTNFGTVPYYPVIKVNATNNVANGGSVGSFDLNVTYPDTSGKQFSWAGSAIVGGTYGEIDTFGNTFFLDGDSTNLSPGINFFTSEYFVLMPGANTITISGCAAYMLWAPAWG